LQGGDYTANRRLAKFKTLLPQGWWFLRFSKALFRRAHIYSGIVTIL
jgi:hypothetical protein